MTGKSCKSLPVAMYHYVNELAGGITLSPTRFEEHCRALAEAGWQGVGLAEAEEYLENGAPLPLKSVLLSFDDGYLDNYFFALPLLRKYGHRGVVFAVSDRLEKGGPVRASVEDLLDGRASVPDAVRVPEERSPQGFRIRRDVFLNHAEAKMADAQGTLAVASHSRGHFGVCLGPEFDGFFRPGDMPRTFYRTEAPMPWGMPNFRIRAGLLHRAFVPDPEMMRAITRLVPQDVGQAAEFFANRKNEDALARLVGGFAGRMGRFETDGERRERMWQEIAGGKAELESILGHSVRSLCWPWGDYCDEAHGLAREAGFSVFFTTAEGPNPPGSAAAAHRFKGKDKAGRWLLSRAFLYSRPVLGHWYARMRM